MSDFMRELTIQVGKKLRVSRKKLKLSMYELYKLTGVSSSTINDIEHFKYFPKLSVLYNLSKGLNIALSELVNIPETEDKHIPKLSVLDVLRIYGLSDEKSREALAYIEYLKSNQ